MNDDCNHLNQQHHKHHAAAAAASANTTQVCDIRQVMQVEKSIPVGAHLSVAMATKRSTAYHGRPRTWK